MTLKERLLSKGYLPENLPPAFFSADIADYIADQGGGGWWSNTKAAVRPAAYNASKRGLTRRVFSLSHPVTIRDMAKFVEERWGDIATFFGQIDFSMSTPKEGGDIDRAIDIGTHGALEAAKIDRLSGYRFVAKTDISRFYHSVYTHSLPWAYHGKAKSKADRDPASKDVFFNRADYILRCGQDGQTIGIPVGPDTSRIVAEVLAVAIDLEFRARCDVADFEVVRYVDDVWIGANSHAEAERSLWRYREAMREFELDINETKTKIYSSDFRFADAWPSDLSVALELSLSSDSPVRSERLRSALEQAFAMTAASGDDGILKYVIRFLDRRKVAQAEWGVVEPFLKRCVVHFGHSVDYVARVIVWRHLAKGDLDRRSWSKILAAIIDTHGRIGNDSEVCWALYACARLRLAIDSASVNAIIRNCGALSLIALLSCAELGFADSSAFDAAHARMQLESATGPYWPVLLEWHSRKWPAYKTLEVNNDTIKALVEDEAVLFDLNRLPLVFKDIEESDFDEVDHAIEDRPSIYDDDGREGDDDDDGLVDVSDF